MKINPFIEAVIKAAVEITPQRKQQALDILSGKVKQLPTDKTDGSVLFTQVQAAKFLGLSRSTIRRMTQAGEITPIPVHGSKRYRKVDLEKLIGLK